MSGVSSGPVTQLLDAVGRGDTHAHDQLWEAVYEELRAIAARQMRDERTGRTLQPTALVHEAYFRLVGDEQVHWNGRRHFFAAAAEAMRRIRIDDARRRSRLKRGGGRPNAHSSGQNDASPSHRAPPPGAAFFDADLAELLSVDEAISKLERFAPRQAQVVKLRYHSGLTASEVALALDIAPRTVNAEWRLARAWLHRELGCRVAPAQ